MTGPFTRLRTWVRTLGGVLNGDPGGDRASRLLHHGIRVGILVAVAFAAFLFFPTHHVSDFAGLERGVVAPEDVIAEFDFEIPKSEEELRREQAEAARAVTPVFEYRPEAIDTVQLRLDTFFSAVDSVVTAAERSGEAPRAALRAFMEDSRIPPPPGGVDRLLDPRDRGAIHSAADLAVRQLFPIGVAAEGLPTEPHAPIRIVYPDGREQFEVTDSVLTPDRFFRLAAERLPDRLGGDAAELQRLILSRSLEPSLAYAEAVTEAARARARAAVDPIRTTVLRGERIVAAMEQVTEREEERLRAYHAALEARGMAPDGRRLVLPALGAFLFNLLVLGILGLLLWFFRRELYHDLRAVVLLALLVTVTVGAASLIARFELAPELIPVTFGVLIVAALFGGRFALVMALVMAFLIGGQQPFLGLTAPFAAAMGGSAAAFAIRAVERRSQTWLFVSIISAAYVAVAVTLGLMRSREVVDVFWSMGFGVTNAVVSSLLAIGFLPLLESLTRITTDQTLLELSDLNRPLLKRLSLEASGTYSHTINVANLSEAACNGIGANGLLARVGVYYHDIGKLVKPQYFVENQPRGRNPHDKLKPSMSASIIRSHVVEGLKMAEEARLPEVIKAFIAEHHGTQQISFFYERAREEEPDVELNPATFSYPGPKPQTRETAIVMLADSVESASRVLADPSPGKLRELVDSIVANKISAGQLDQCPLTLREIDVVKDHIANVLTGIYHHRIDYPGQITSGGPPRVEGPAPVAGGTLRR